MLSELLEELLKTKDKKEQRKIMNRLNRLGMDDYTISVLIAELRKEIKEYAKSLEVNKSDT